MNPIKEEGIKMAKDSQGQGSEAEQPDGIVGPPPGTNGAGGSGIVPEELLSATYDSKFSCLPLNKKDAAHS